MRVGAIIQARMGSSRLPGKVLLDLSGEPIIQHVYDRASQISEVNKVVVGTTIEKSDDELASYLQHKEIEFYRGSENNVLNRYYDIATTEKFDVIIRITSDNPLFEFEAASELIDKLVKEKLDYVTKKGIPYGANLEVFTYSALERSLLFELDDQDKEHVTRFILNHPDIFKIGFIDNIPDNSDIRVTVDTVFDYRKMKTIYKQLYFGKPIVSYEAYGLIKSNLYKMVLGGAQLGFKYGIGNKIDFSKENSFEILSRLHKCGLRVIDTAQAYGDSEKIIGEYSNSSNSIYSVITKFTLDDLSVDAILVEILERKIEISKMNIGNSQLDYFFIHHFSDYKDNRELIDILVSLRQAKKINKIGISIYSPDEIEELLINNALGKLDAIQIPFNIVDTRWYDYITILKEYDVDIFVRSIFLQGIFFEHAQIDNLIIKDDIINIRNELKKIADIYNLTIYELMLIYPYCIDDIDYVIAGIDSKEQLDDLAKTLSNKTIKDIEAVKSLVLDKFSMLSESVLNPALWN